MCNIRDIVFSNVLSFNIDLEKGLRTLVYMYFKFVWYEIDMTVLDIKPTVYV